MASKQTQLQIVIDAQDRTKGAFSAVGSNLEAMKQSHDRLVSGMKSVGTAGVVAFGTISGAIAMTVREAMRGEAATNRLTQILKTSRGATDDQVAALLRQANALQKVGVVAAENVVQTQAQLATFDLTAASIEALTPAILDYVVAEKGATASTEDFKALTNGLAQALQGNFASLTRTGFVLDEVTREMISNGTEAERTEALVSVLNSTYAGFNETARNTAEGSLQALRNELGDLASSLGETFIPIMHEVVKAIQPVVERITAWIKENPELTRNIIIIALAFTALMAVLLPIAIILPGLIAMFTGIGAVLAFVASGPGIAIVAAIAVIGGTLGYMIKQGYFTKQAWAEVWLGIQVIVAESVNKVINMSENMVNFIIDGVNFAIRAINKVISLASKIPGVGDKLSDATISELDRASFARVDINTLAAGSLGGGVAAPATNIVMTGNTFLSEDVAEEIGNLIMSKLKLSNAL